MESSKPLRCRIGQLFWVWNSVKVRHTTKSWIVHVPLIRGKNPAKVYGLAMNKGNRIAVALANKYGVVLAEGAFVGGEMGVEAPMAKLCTFAIIL